MLDGNNYLLFLISWIVLFITISIIVITALRPGLVWPLLIFSSIVGSGSMIYGYSIIDEYILGCTVFGMLIFYFSSDKCKNKSKRTKPAQMQTQWFYVLIVYMVFQSLRGMILMGSVEKIRWVAFYVMIGVLSYLLSSHKFPLPTAKRTHQYIIIFSAIYLIIYLGSGVLYEAFNIGSRFDLQRVWWGTTAYALLPVAFAFPSFIKVLSYREKRYQILNWLTILLVFLAALYYDSRIVTVTVLAYLFVGFPRIGLKRFVKIIMLSAVLLSLFIMCFWPSYRDFNYFKNDLFTAAGALLEPEDETANQQDIDRVVHMKVAYKTIEDNPYLLLFGYGFRMHGSVIGDGLRELYLEYNRPDLAMKVTDNESTEGFTALIVDTGIIGFLLHLICFSIVAVELLRQKFNKYRYLQALIVVFLFLWLFVINILDVTLWYLAIMPAGIIPLLNNLTEKDKFAEI